MPERKGTRTFDTSDVQGEGSWVQIRAMTVGEVLASQREVEARDNLLYKVGAFLGRLVRHRPPQSELTRQFLARSLQYVQAWNWVDSAGEPLPAPAEDPRVLERLTNDEMALIVACVRGERQSEERKN